MTAYRFNGAGLFEEDYDMILDADNESADLGVVAQAFYGLSEPLEGITDDVTSLDVLYLSSMKLDANWRGYGLGLMVALILIRAHGQEANLAMIPSPLENSDGSPEVGAEAIKRGRAKLTRYWKKLGMVEVPGQPGMLWHNSGEKLRPR